MLAKNLEPYMTWGMMTMLATGFMLFCSEAMKCFVNEGFKFKMAVLFPAPSGPSNVTNKVEEYTGTLRL